MTHILEIPMDLEMILQQKAQNEGISMSEFLLRLAQQEAGHQTYTQQEVDGFLREDCLSAKLSEKVQRLLGK